MVEMRQHVAKAGQLMEMIQQPVEGDSIGFRSASLPAS